MAKTKQQIRNWLNSQVGRTVICPNNRALDGQCVTLIKALLAFLGAPNPWAARGNAKDVANNYVRQGIANNGDGWLRVCVNPSMGGGYGHVWIDLKDEANYEQNGKSYLKTTKNTRPISNARQIVNLDKYAVADPVQPQLNGRVEQHGTFKASVNRNIRRSPSLSGAVAGTFTAGATQKYDSYIDSEGFRWVSWVGASGNRNYVAVRRLSDNKCYGQCY